MVVGNIALILLWLDIPPSVRKIGVESDLSGDGVPPLTAQ